MSDRSEVQQRNVELVVAWLDAWEQGPQNAIDRVEEFIHPEFEWRPGGVTLGREVHSGREELIQYMKTTAETTTTVTIERYEVRAVGDDRVLVLGHLQYTGKDQPEDPMLDGEYALVFTLEDGLLRSGQSFLSHEVAERTAEAGGA